MANSFVGRRQEEQLAFLRRYVHLHYKGGYGSVTDSDTGLVQMGLRQYDPVSGRWLTRDPIGYNGGLNLYAYCGGDPVNFADPMGTDYLQDYLNGVGDALSGMLSGFMGNVGTSFCAAGDAIGSLPKSYGNYMMGAAPFIAMSQMSNPQGPMISPFQHVGDYPEGHMMNEDGIAFADPGGIRFSQDSISPNFKGGGSVAGMAEGLKDGSILPESVPPIRLVGRDGQFFSLDNRRLEAFQRAGVNIPYRMATPEEILKDIGKFTTENGGISVRVRGE